jgi:2-amino-4-hydroxy-6-hydroxymethyldihydropteridine diphosphokinase
MPRVFVSIGSNQDREASLRRAVRELEQAFDDVRLSPIYETAAVGFEGEDFFNLVASFETRTPLPALLEQLRQIETRCGRVRAGKRFGPRTMDIDVLTYGDHVSEDEGLDVPRAEMLSQAYVLRPMAELAPGLRHPLLGESFAALRERLHLDESGMRRCAFDPRSPEPAAR